MYSGVQEEETTMNPARVVICFLTHMRFLTLEKCLLLSEPPQDSSEVCFNSCTPIACVKFRNNLLKCLSRVAHTRALSPRKNPARGQSKMQLSPVSGVTGDSAEETACWCKGTSVVATTEGKQNNKADGDKTGIKSSELLPADWVSSLRRLSRLEMY